MSVGAEFSVPHGARGITMGARQAGFARDLPEARDIGPVWGGREEIATALGKLIAISRAARDGTRAHRAKRLQVQSNVVHDEALALGVEGEIDPSDLVG